MKISQIVAGDPSILCLETTTKTCAVGIVIGEHIVSVREDHSHSYSHAEQLHSFIAHVLNEAELTLEAIDAVAVSKGPGSYTGLRIGVSAAKGIAYALKKPLIAVDPLEALARQVLHRIQPRSMLVPMIDARRMEVFCAGFDASLKPVFATRAEIVTPGSFPEGDAFDHLYYFGDGAEKCTTQLSGITHAKYLEGIGASISGMVAPAYNAFVHKEFVDVAYFEPFYLKDFIAGKPKSTRL